MARVLLIEPEKCVGCGICELVCSYGHEGEFTPFKGRIKTFTYSRELVFVPLTCLHCAEPYCLDTCPAGALYRDPETGAVALDQERCVGCKMCVLACPFGNMGYRGEKAVKCDLCGGEPRCVEFCTGGALQYVEADEYVLSRKQKAADRWKQWMTGGS